MAGEHRCRHCSSFSGLQDELSKALGNAVFLLRSEGLERKGRLTLIESCIVALGTYLFIHFPFGFISSFD